MCGTITLLGIPSGAKSLTLENTWSNFFAMCRAASISGTI